MGLFLVFFKSPVQTRKSGVGHPLEVLNSLHEGVVLFDKKGKILSFNRKANELLELPSLKCLFPSFFSLEGKSSLLAECQCLLKQYLMKREPQFRPFCSEAGSHLDLMVRPVGKTGLSVLLLQDGSNEQVIAKVGKDFIANASHELRTPITIIKGFAETLRDLPEISEAMLEDFMEKILRNCQRVDLLVKNLLILADLDATATSRMQECDLVTLIDGCIYNLLTIHPDVDVEILHNQDEISILGYPDLLELAMMNLLENSVKYSSSPAHITMTIEKCHDKVYLIVLDKGIGIPEHDLDHIFERFYRVDKARSRRLGGAGLGLSIVKTIIAKHRAEISVSSTIGEGTRFCITFNS
jgi:two-component system phosphate regulon sensor histidine kinase PhoR